MNKTAASAAHVAKCILLHAHSCTTTPDCASTNKNFIYSSLYNKLAWQYFCS